MRKFLTITLASALTLLIYVRGVHAAIVNAASCSASDVQAAIISASEGDTVVIPAGNATWTTKVSIPKGITLKGAGIDKTVLTDEVPVQIMLHVTSTSPYRITDITFKGNPNTPNNAAHGMLELDGVCHGFRVDHCKFSSWPSNMKAILTIHDQQGLIDNCTFNNSFNESGTVGGAIETYGNKYNGIGDFGDNAWAQASEFGTDKFLFIENCTFNYQGNNQQMLPGAIGADWGARFVFRHNKVYNAFIGTHGTDTSGRYRSVRAFEIYGNTFVNTANTVWPEAIYIRGGTGVVHDNTFTGFVNSVILASYRTFRVGNPWGSCDGFSPYDDNDPTIYETGKATSATANTGTTSLTLVDTSKNWTTNQWVGYLLTNTTDRTQDNTGSIITSNTSDTLTFASTGTSLINNMMFAVGDGYQIRKAVCIDQPGRGKGLMMTDWTPVLQSTGSPGWPQNELDPIYEWNDTSPDSSTAIRIVSANQHELEGVSFYNDKQKPGYTPFVYPHPLNMASIQPPKDLRLIQ